MQASHEGSHFLRRRGVLFVAALSACSSKAQETATDGGPQTSVVEVSGVFRPAGGLAAQDFELVGADPAERAAVSAEGGFRVKVGAEGTVMLFGGPREGTDTAQKLGGEGGLHMTPVVGSRRIIGPPYQLAASGEAVIDGKTTILALLLTSPALAHHDANLAGQELTWLLDKVNGGWPVFEAAVKAYEELLSRTSDGTAFADAFAQCLEAIGEEMPATQKDSKSDVGSSGYPLTDEPAIVVGKRVVSKLEQRSAANGELTLRPGTEENTGLDYLYAVRPVNMADFPDGKSSPAFLTPETSPWTKTGGVTPLRRGFVPASSYAKMLNVVQAVVKAVSALLTDDVKQDLESFSLPMNQQIYEVRFFSGAWPTAALQKDADEQQQNWSVDGHDATFQNLASTSIEGLLLVPGVNEALGSTAGEKVIKDGLKLMLVDLNAILTAGQLPDRRQLFGLCFKHSRNLLEALATVVANELAVGGAAKSGWIAKLGSWLGWAGKKVRDAVCSVPAKFANAGAMAHRVYTLLQPASITEYYLVYSGGAEKPAGCPSGVAEGKDYCDGDVCFNCASAGPVKLYDCKGCAAASVGCECE